MVDGNVVVCEQRVQTVLTLRMCSCRPDSRSLLIGNKTPLEVQALTARLIQDSSSSKIGRGEWGAGVVDSRNSKQLIVNPRGARHTEMDMKQHTPSCRRAPRTTAGHTHQTHRRTLALEENQHKCKVSDTT